MQVMPIQENKFEYKGYDCIVLFMPMCHRCGYVGIPIGHKYYKMNYNDIDIECHGGLTYSRDYLIGQNDENKWWIGFDCAHYGDEHDWRTAREYWKDNPKQLEYINQEEEFYEEFYKSLDDVHHSLCTLNYVEDECQHIVDQLAE